MDSNGKNHEYDGIHEDNHPAPKWWVNLFIASIVWGAGYYYYYTFFSGETLKHKLERELTAIEAEKLKTGSSGPSEDELMSVISDAGRMKAGRESFQAKCASCHGEHGQGLIGPNLADHFWIHGKGTAGDIYKVVDEGVADKGMPPWGPLLSSTEMANLVAFVKSMQGTNPANPKAPQGVEVKP